MTSRNKRTWPRVKQVCYKLQFHKRKTLDWFVCGKYTSRSQNEAGNIVIVRVVRTEYQVCLCVWVCERVMSKVRGCIAGLWAGVKLVKGHYIPQITCDWLSFQRRATSIHEACRCLQKRQRGRTIGIHFTIFCWIRIERQIHSKSKVFIFASFDRSLIVCFL